MRKFITFSVFFLLFSMFSGSVFAGKQDDACDEFKAKGSKGLYGLCNAYQNALAHDDLEAMEDIYSSWLKKAGDDGDPAMPNYRDPTVSTAVCPCWPEGELKDRGFPVDCLVQGTYALAMYGGSDFREYSIGSVFDTVNKVNIPNSCELGINLVQVRSMIGMTEDQYDACLSDISTIIANDFPEIDYPSCSAD